MQPSEASEASESQGTRVERRVESTEVRIKRVYKVKKESPSYNSSWRVAHLPSVINALSWRFESISPQ